MRVFLSYPSDERTTAERINLALGAAGFDVFFDRDDLPHGEEFDGAVRRAVKASSLFVFLITPTALEPGRYTLTELRLAQDRWPQPGRRVLPVMLRPTPMQSIPPYLRAVSILEPHGDVAAEVAHAAEKLLSPRSPWQRIRTLAGSRAGVGALALTGAIAATVWTVRPWTARDDSASIAGTPLDPAVRERARFVSATENGYAVITENPNEVVRFDTEDRLVGTRSSLPGEPVAIRDLARQLLVATRAPNAIAVWSKETGTMTDTILVDGAPIDEDPEGRVSREIASMDVVDGVLWITTREGQGEAAVLRLRPNGEWVVATRAMTVPPDSLEFDPDGLEVQAIGPSLWAIDTDAEPAVFYQLMGTVRVDRVTGEDVPMIRCARDIAEGPDGRMLVLSCDHELLEIFAAGRDFTLVRSSPALPAGEVLEDSTRETIAADGEGAFVAYNTVSNDAPRRTRVVRVDPGGSVIVLDRADAIVESMAITDRGVLVVLRMADGSRDARRLDRLFLNEHGGA